VRSDSLLLKEGESVEAVCLVGVETGARRRRTITLELPTRDLRETTGLASSAVRRGAPSGATV